MWLTPSTHPSPSPTMQELAQHLYNNESPSQQPYVEKIPRPTEGAFRRIHQPVFPTLNVHAVQQVLDEGRQKTNLKQRSVRRSDAADRACWREGAVEDCFLFARC